VRARDLDIRLQGEPGPFNAITDVGGVEVGMVTLVEDIDASVAARTGVTAILPLGRAGIGRSVPGAVFSLNGNGEMTGTHWIRETGAVNGPVMITNTHAVGAVHEGVIRWMARHRPDKAAEWLLPIVAETWDGYLNSVNEPFVSAAHAVEAIDSAAAGPVSEGSCGGGTGMSCYGFKGGNGTSSRIVEFAGKGYTLGVFLQVNFGDRSEFAVNGIALGDLDVPDPEGDLQWFFSDKSAGRLPGGAGSVIAIVATDAPLLPGQCEALARRVPLGLARTGTTGGHLSGDIFLAFSTANEGVLDSGYPDAREELRSLAMVPWNRMDRFYAAVVHAVEEAVLNALVNNADMTGRAGHFSPALPHHLMTARLREGR
jgi:D-aminopeptidase